MTDPRPRIAASFDKQPFMRTLGATLHRVDHGLVEIRLTIAPHLTQQHGFIHAGAIAAIADSACGYAALTTMPEGAEVLSIEFKINMLAPAVGDALHAAATVIRAGRTITVTRADVTAHGGGAEPKPVAAMQATMIRRDP